MATVRHVGFVGHILEPPAKSTWRCLSLCIGLGIAAVALMTWKLDIPLVASRSEVIFIGLPMAIQYCRVYFGLSTNFAPFHKVSKPIGKYHISKKCKDCTGGHRHTFRVGKESRPLPTFGMGRTPTLQVYQVRNFAFKTNNADMHLLSCETPNKLNSICCTY